VKVRFLTLAQQELDNAVAWYNEQAEGLGQEFLDELDRVVRRVLSFPLYCPEIEVGI
jgi:16S rRNA G527 N7-methylase RsmG